MVILPPGISEGDCVTESHFFPFYNPLWDWDSKCAPPSLKACTAQLLRQLVWLLGLKVCVIIIWSVKLTGGIVLVSDLQAIFIKIQLKSTPHLSSTGIKRAYHHVLHFTQMLSQPSSISLTEPSLQPQCLKHFKYSMSA